MRRTIAMNPNNTMQDLGDVFYENKKVDYLVGSLRNHFELEDGYKYVITIVEGKGFTFEVSHGGYLYDIYADGEKWVGHICREHFIKIFFVPDLTKSYKITVRRVD